MTINVVACLIVLLGTALGTESPLAVTQMLWVNLIMDTFAAMALSSLPANKRVLNEKPRNPESHIINRQMLFRIIGIGSVFFVALAGLWQLLWHTDITCVRDLLTIDAAKLFVSGFADLSHTKAHLSGYEMGVFFSVFVMLQFWNLFNAKYYRTDRSFILDIIDLIWDFYEDNGMLEISFDIPVEENENDIQVKLIEYVKHEIMSDNKEKIDLKIVEQIVLAELAYENTLDEF